MSIDYSNLPEHCQEGMRHYIEDGIPTGSFLQAVLENNLAEAACQADVVNFEELGKYGNFLMFQAPGDCWGSPEAVKNWIENKRKERDVSNQSQAGTV